MMLNKVKTVENDYNYRYERKFIAPEFTKQEVESIVKHHSAMFLEVYYERYVNNIYFDSFNMSNYCDNITGLRDRIKVRIRWYGELFGEIKNPTLELKIKNGFLGKKKLFPLKQFSITEDFNDDVTSNVFRISDIPDIVKLRLQTLKPVLLNRYCRKYYQSADKNFRITIDYDMEFYKIAPIYNCFLNKSVDWRNTLIELKYDHDMEHYAESISNYFPFRVSKISKYIYGIERLGLS